jgi:tetratricopeptide (TPR) repeat protein
LNVKGSPAELVPIFRSVEGHPLLVQALASEVANYKRAPGDFAHWQMDHPWFDPTSLPLAQSRTHILTFALDGISDKVREVLYTLVGFRMPASYAALEALLVGPDKPCGSIQRLDRALTELEDRGLIGWDREANRYDAHPIVRGVVWQCIGVDNQRAVYAALDAHFELMSTPEARNVESLSDLTPAIERYHTLIGLKRYDDAFKLFRDRLDAATWYYLGAHRERIAWLERLFPRGMSELPSLAIDAAKRYALDTLAVSYRASGQPSRAARLHKRAAEIDAWQQGAPLHLTTPVNLTVALFEMGALREAKGVALRALILSRELGDDHHQAFSLLGCDVLDHPFDCVALCRARHIYTKLGHFLWVCEATNSLAARSIRLGDLPKGRALADKAWELASDRKLEHHLISAALNQGRVALGLGNLKQADERLHHALTRARTVNAIEAELPVLIAIAQLRLAQGHLAEARASLDDVWDAAERGPYRVALANAYNVLADIVLAEGDRPAAIAAAAEAYRVAWCDGPPHAYRWGLEKAKARLAALGAPEPSMPPFDESKFEPMPEIDINPKDEYWIDPNSVFELRT